MISNGMIFSHNKYNLSVARNYNNRLQQMTLHYKKREENETALSAYFRHHKCVIYTQNMTVKAAASLEIFYHLESLCILTGKLMYLRYLEYLPDHFENLTNLSLVHNLPVPQSSSKIH